MTNRSRGGVAMIYKAITVANYIIEYSNKNMKPVSNLKLQKLLYYVQAAFLVEFSRPAFSNDIRAWKYGPVVESVYHMFKIYANDSIKHCNNDITSDMISCEDDEKLIKSVVDSYVDYSPIEIMLKTHQEVPWIESNELKKGSIIDNDAIKEFYSKNRDLIYGNK